MHYKTGTILRVLRDERESEPFSSPPLAVALGSDRVFAFLPDGRHQSIPAADLVLEETDEEATPLHLRRRRAFELPATIEGQIALLRVLVEDSRGRWETFTTRGEALEALIRRDRAEERFP